MQRTLYWKLFANYFMLILIPLLAASLLIHLFVVQMIENDAERYNTVIMNRFSEQTDTALHQLQTSMIHLLSTSNLKSLLLLPDQSEEHSESRMELLHSLRDQLQQLESNEMVDHAYFYFAGKDLIVAAETYTSKAYYYDERLQISKQSRRMLEAELYGKKMMDFLETAALTTAVSYPFNSNDPDVYLLVALRSDKLRKQITIDEKWVTGTAIMNAAGKIIADAGLSPQVQEELTRRIRAGSIDGSSRFIVDGQMGQSWMKSVFSESWHYISLVDLKALMKPVRIVQGASWLFFIFFLIIGGFVSYQLSKRLYRPIREINDELKLHHMPAPGANREGNELDMIKRYSQSIMVKNKELYQLVSGMQPFMQEQFVTQLLLGQYRDELSIDYYAREIGFAYNKHTPRTVIAIALHFNAVPYASISETSKMFWLAELKDKIADAGTGQLWFCLTKPDVLACVLHHRSDTLAASNEQEHSFSDYDSAALKSEALRLAERIQALLLQHGKDYCKATIGVGKPVKQLDSLHRSYENAVDQLIYRGLKQTVEICANDFSESKETQQAEAFLSSQEVAQMMNQYKAGQLDELLQFVLRLLEDGEKRDATAVQIKYLCTDVLHTWIRALELERHDWNVPYYYNLFDRINRCMTWEELRSSFTEIHRQLFSKPQSSKGGQFSEILLYIEQHIDQELSIEHFAEQMKMSTGHFSRKFKEEVGEKYVEYIAKIRLNRAKQLLLDTDLKMDDIAEQVGYWGRNSLIRAFRKYEGITPAKYRSIHMPD